MAPGMVSLAVHLSPLVVAFGICLYVGHRQHLRIMAELDVPDSADREWCARHGVDLGHTTEAGFLGGRQR